MRFRRYSAEFNSVVCISAQKFDKLLFAEYPWLHPLGELQKAEGVPKVYLVDGVKSE